MVLRAPKLTLVIAAVLFAVSLLPLRHIGGEFMPRLDEGDLLYMPSALPGLSIGKATELLQQTDRLIRTLPEVARVSARRAARRPRTDPAPLEMFETTIQFKPRDQWRPGMTPEMLIEELDRIVRVPGLTNIWVPPIRNRIDMLATGIKSPVGVKWPAPTSRRSTALRRIERAVKDVPACERIGRATDRRPLCRCQHPPRCRRALRHEHRRRAVGDRIGGRRREHRRDRRRLQRFPISVRYPRELRDSLENCGGCRSSPSAVHGWCCPTWPSCASRTVRRCSEARTRVWPGGFMSTFAAGFARRGARYAARGRRQSAVAGGLLGFVGPVRIP